MRIEWMALPVAVAGITAATGCEHRLNVQCVEDSNCDLQFGGACALDPLGNHWCAYPDPLCASGMRYSTLDVGDGISGECVGVHVDAGVDSMGADASPARPPLSCIALPHTCGAGRNDDCCHTIQVPGGTYFRSYDLVGDSQSGTTGYPATVSTFLLDKYEVTVARFRAFVAAGQGTQANPPANGSGTHAKIPGSGWEASWNTELPVDRAALLAQVNYCPTALLPDTWTDSLGVNEDRPMTCLTWYEAFAFCIWDGGYLPTQAEWNYTAAGGDQQRAYPWSTPSQSLIIDGSYASYSTGTVNSPNCIGDGLPGCAVTDLVPVGTKPLGDGRWGHSDLAGNVSEWLLDWWGYPATCIDCANLIVPVFDPERLARGGNIMSLGDGTFGVRIASDSGLDFPSNVGLTGVRCARAP